MIDKEVELAEVLDTSEDDRLAYEARELEYQAWAASEPSDFGYDY